MSAGGYRSLWAFALALGFVSVLLLFSFHEADEDVWGRMAAGRLTVANGGVAKVDVFAYVPTKPRWIDHEWLAGVVFYEVHRLLGGRGLVLLRGALGLLTIALTLEAAMRTGCSRWTAAFLCAAGWPLLAQGLNSVVRAQAFSFLFFALFVFVLEATENRFLVAFAALVPATALWANLHGGFVVGPLLVAAHASGRVFERRRADALALFVLAAAGLLASFVNPYGLDYWRYLATALVMPRPEILEWRHLALGVDHLHIELSVLLAVVLVLSRPPRPSHLLVLGGTLAATLLHIRFAPFFGLATLAYLPRSFELSLARGQKAFPVKLAPSLPPLAAMLLAQALLFLGLALSWYRRDWELEMRVDPGRYPVEAIERLKTEPPGNLAVFFNWGEYALYHLYPRDRVSIDGRYETVYPEEVVRANWEFTNGVPGSEAFLDSPPADLALYPSDSGAARLLGTAEGWELVQTDARFVLYRRR
jgi:hypothetical protein